VDGDVAHQVTVSVDWSSESAFTSLVDQTVAVTTQDNDTAGFTVTGGPLTVDESGMTTQSFTVVLDAAPENTVMFDVSTNDSTESMPDYTTLTFSSSDWNMSQTVTVTGQDDSIDDGDIAHLVTVSVNDVSSDDPFDSLADQTVAVTTTDDDTAGFTVSGGPLTVDEWGSTQSFDVVLDAAPLTNVVFDVSTDDSSESSVAHLRQFDSGSVGAAGSYVDRHRLWHYRVSSSRDGKMVVYSFRRTDGPRAMPTACRALPASPVGGVRNSNRLPEIVSVCC
jgi:hypothetical protein